MGEPRLGQEVTTNAPTEGRAGALFFVLDIALKGDVYPRRNWGHLHFTPREQTHLCGDRTRPCESQVASVPLPISADLVQDGEGCGIWTEGECAGRRVSPVNASSPASPSLMIAPASDGH